MTAMSSYITATAPRWASTRPSGRRLSSHLRGPPMRIVEVDIVCKATVARDDNIPVLALALEQGAAGICFRAAVVDLIRGLHHLLVGNHLFLARGLGCWLAPIHPHSCRARLLTITVFSRKH